MFYRLVIFVSFFSLSIASNTNSYLEQNEGWFDWVSNILNRLINIVIPTNGTQSNGSKEKNNKTIKESSVSELSLQSITVENCGISHSNYRSSAENKIVGGKISQIGEYPWNVMLHIKNAKNKTVLCGGSLINENFILTAAHCVSNEIDGKFSSNSIEVWAGVHNRNKLDSNSQKRFADCVIVHSNWRGKGGGMVHDLAIIRIPFNNPFNINHKNGGVVNGICFPPKTNPPFEYIGDARIAGWGLTRDRFLFGQVSNELKFTNVKVIDNKTCRKYPFPIEIKETMICQGVDRTAPCQGDSGGPLITYLNNRAVQIGIVSFGPGFCANSFIPNAVYTQVSYYLDWIQKTIISNDANANCSAKGLLIPNSLDF